MKIFWGLSLFLLCAGTALAQEFLPSTEDIPLMSGLYQVEENATFDSPSERMSLISAKTHEKPAQVQQFYHQVLTNLGWTVVQNNHYTRGNDTLTLELTPTKSETTLQFTLVQKN